MEEMFDIGVITESIVDMIDDHILVCNIEGQIVFANKAMQSYLGYDDLELKQKSFMNMVTNTYKSKAIIYVESASESPSSWEEFVFDCKNNMMKLHLKIIKKNNLIYIYGNEIYVEYERIRKKLDNEITKAIKIHKRSLPEHLPNTENISFASLYIPADRLGGDIYDVFKVDNGLLNDYFEQYVCFIADVSGHGLDSAMLSIFIKDTIRSYFRLKHSPGHLVSPKEIMDFVLEQYILEGYPDEYLVCLFLTVFDLKTSELTYCNAGFQYSPLVVRDRQNIVELNKGGFPITTGIDSGLYNFKDYSIKISSEMTVFIMSDGLPELRSDNEFYEERLKELVSEIYGLNPDNIISRIHEDFTQFLRYEKINDDITLVVVRIR